MNHFTNLLYKNIKFSSSVQNPKKKRKKTFNSNLILIKNCYKSPISIENYSQMYTKNT